jgi:hypothetical protein
VIFSWVEFAIIALKVINAIINWAHDRGMIDEGRRQILAELALKLAVKVETRDKIRERVDAMDEAEVDKELGGLVDPPAAGAAQPVHPRTD